MTMVRQAVPLNPCWPMMEQLFTCNPWRTPHGASGCLKEDVPLWEACEGAGPGRSCGPMEKGIHTGAVWDELLPLGRTQAGEDLGELFSVGETPCWRKQSC